MSGYGPGGPAVRCRPEAAFITYRALHVVTAAPDAWLTHLGRERQGLATLVNKRSEIFIDFVKHLYSVECRIIVFSIANIYFL